MTILGLPQYLATLEHTRHRDLQYGAGLWGQDLAVGPLWYITLGKAAQARNTRASSWSEIYVDGILLSPPHLQP